MKEGIKISIVVPIYNEEESILPMNDAVRKVGEAIQGSYEVIFVDDGSKDHSFKRLKQLHENDPHIKVVRFRKNYGQTAAMAAGFRAAKGEVVISMDGDLQNDPKDIPRLLSKLEEGFDVVCGWRKDRKDKLISRKIPSRIANWLIGKITGVSIHDNGCSLKAYRRDIIKRVSLYSELHRFIPAMSTLAGARIAEIVVTHHARKFGSSKYGISRAWRVFLDLFLIKMLTGFAERPSLWFGLWSLPSILFGVAGFLLAISFDVSGIVFPSLGFLFLILGVHLLLMGVVGEVIVYSGNYRPSQMILVRGSSEPKQVLKEQVL